MINVISDVDICELLGKIIVKISESEIIVIQK